VPAFLSQKGVEGERKENSPVDCFPRESYTNLSLHTRRNKRARTILFAKHTSGTPKKQVPKGTCFLSQKGVEGERATVRRQKQCCALFLARELYRLFT